MILELTAIVECDECGEEESIDLAGNLSERGFEQALRQSGWMMKKDWSGPKTLCDNCKDKSEDE